MTKPVKRVSREKPVQKAVTEYLRRVLPGAVVHHARNEINKRGAGIARELAEATRLGSVKGFPDIIALPPANIGPLFFEVKAPGSYPSPEQREMHEAMEALGYRVAVVRSQDDARDALDAWGVWRTDRRTNFKAQDAK